MKNCFSISFYTNVLLPLRHFRCPDKLYRSNTGDVQDAVVNKKVNCQRLYTLKLTLWWKNVSALLLILVFSCPCAISGVRLNFTEAIPGMFKSSVMNKKVNSLRLYTFKITFQSKTVSKFISTLMFTCDCGISGVCVHVWSRERGGGFCTMPSTTQPPSCTHIEPYAMMHVCVCVCACVRVCVCARVHMCLHVWFVMCVCVFDVCVYILCVCVCVACVRGVFFSLSLSLCVYVYMCVCVCVSEWVWEW